MNKEQSMTFSAEQLDKLHEKSLNLFIHFKDICDKNGLLMYFCGGCCIGALRHGGFIPWDDDIDVFMPREDYEKLEKIWNEQANIEKYSYHKTDKTHFTRNQFATINDNNTTFIKKYQADLDINHGLVLDILPLDGCPNSWFARKMQKIWALIYSLFIIGQAPENHSKTIFWGGKIILAIFRSKKIRYKIWRLAERKMTKYKISECDKITELCSGPHYMQNEYPAEAFRSAVYKKFEGYDMPIPCGYDEYLKIAFGDYMTPPPLEKQAPHHDVDYIDMDNGYLKYRGEYYFTNKGVK